EAYTDVLRLQKYLLTPGAALTARTGGLGAAKGLPQVADILAVDEAHPGVDRSRHPVGAAEIFAPDITAEPIANIVGLGNRIGLVGEGNEAGHGPEDLLLCDGHAVVDVGKYAGPYIVAGTDRGRQLSGVGGALEAAAQQRRAFLGAVCDIAADLGEGSLADHRADERFLIKRVAHADAFRTFAEASRKVRIDGFLHEDAGTGGAALPIVREDHEERGVEGARQVGVPEYHERALAAQFHTEFLEAGPLDDTVAGEGRAGEGDGANIRMLAQGLPDILTQAVHDVQHPGGNPGLERQLAQTCRR